MSSSRTVVLILALEALIGIWAICAYGAPPPAAAPKPVAKPVHHPLQLHCTEFPRPICQKYT